MNILIVKTSSMGDVLHTIPAARAIKEAYPGAHLGWAVEKAHAEVLRGQPWLDERIVWNRSGVGAFADFIRQLRSRRWDMAVDFQGLFRSGLITRLSGASRRIGYSPTRERAHWFYTERVPLGTMERHAVERYLDLAVYAGATPRPALDRPYLEGHVAIEDTCERSGDERFPLYPSNEDREAVGVWLAERGFDPKRHRLAILNPHCRKDANRWPPERFAELARRLAAQQGIKVALTGGPATRGLCDEIERLSVCDVWRADGQFGLLGSAALFGQSSVMVTGDTGPMHIAVAVGTPVVALFGPANPLRTGPYASDAIVLREPLECSPCYASASCPLGHATPKCLDLIGVERVLAAVARQLGQVRRKSA